MRVQLITPEKILFEGDAILVEAPGTLGDFGVLPGHAPFVSTLRPGSILIELADHSKRKVAVLSGIAEVTPEHCRLLIETAKDYSGMSDADIAAHRESSRRAVAEAVSDADRRAAGQELALAEAMMAA